jgi:hypothetical protein
MMAARTSTPAAAPRRPPPATVTRIARREWAVPAAAVPTAGRGRCSCGGTCPRCKASARDSGLRLSRTDDALERQADVVAGRIAAGDRGPFDLGAAAKGPTRSPAAPAPSVAPAPLREGLGSTGRALDDATRSDLEAAFGSDFGHVRVHSGGAAARSAARIGARAYAFGRDIVFGAGEYAPATSAGRRLLAHELAHVLQQRSGAAAVGTTVWRAPTIGVLDENFIGPPSASQRRAAKSCPIDCCAHNLGTLHTMPLFFHESRGSIVPEGSARATGIGAELHFIAGPNQPAAGELCNCDAFQMIQIITSTHPADPRGNASFVDNDPAGSQPFYGAPAGIGLSGHGEHAIPPGYADAGGRVTTTESIYDRPYRTPAMLGTTSLSWQAETCVACVKNTEPDRILGCTTYGFTQAYNATTSGFDPVQQISPGCRSRPSANFTTTLSSDPTTSGYDFRAAPLLECLNPTPPGDYPLPTGDTRVA